MRPWICGFLALASTLFSAPSLAVTLVGQSSGPNPPSGYSAGTVRFYDDFQLSGDATVTTVSWWAAENQATTGTFNILFTDVDAIFPGPNTLYSATITATSSVADYFLTRYVVVLPKPALLAGNTNFYLSIYRTDGYFGWAVATGPSAPGIFNGDISYATFPGGGGLQGANLGWQLDGDYGFTPQVPAPATWTMMLIGFGLIGGVARRTIRSSGMPHRH